VVEQFSLGDYMWYGSQCSFPRQHRVPSLHNQTLIIEAKGYVDTGSRKKKQAALLSLQCLVA
jgi:hypothetical protein